ncbi:MAG: ABC transporter substrate-binding protein [Pirellula sp.]|nr:ABC transporter substrate-binding protein [Pirellula sp.]
MIGISHECDFPPDLSHCERLTFSRIPLSITSAEIDALTTQKAIQDDGLFGVHGQRVLELCPDVIITQSICDVCAVSRGALGDVMAELPSATKLLTLSPSTLMDVLESILYVSRELQSPGRGHEVYAQLSERLERLRSQKQTIATKTAVLLEWLDPLFSAGHWNPEIIESAGAKELIGTAGQKSRRIQWEELRAADPDHLVVACCGYDSEKTKLDFEAFQLKHPLHELRCVQNKQVHLLDGNAYFNRPGPRLVDAAELLHELFQ